MPIRRYLGEGGVFTPKTISEMSRALEAATRILGIEGDENQRQIVARFIIQLSREDDSLDSAALGDGCSRPWEASHFATFTPARSAAKPPSD
jgi:hypothetical protein